MAGMSLLLALTLWAVTHFGPTKPRSIWVVFTRGCL